MSNNHRLANTDVEMDTPHIKWQNTSCRWRQRLPTSCHSIFKRTLSAQDCEKEFLNTLLVTGGRYLSMPCTDQTLSLPCMKLSLMSPLCYFLTKQRCYSLCGRTAFFYTRRPIITVKWPIKCRSRWLCGLRPIPAAACCWDRGFKSRWGHACSYFCVCCVLCW